MPTEEYVSAVIRNIRAYGEKYDTVYFGGGTPSLLTPKQIYDILSAADIESGAEISSEANPDSASYEWLSGCLSAGVNRISIGIQSFDDRELSALGRLHDGKAALTALSNAKKAGFDNISADLMLGIPYQNKESLEKNIEILSCTDVTHVSAYMLKIEEGTPLSRRNELISACADEDMSAALYEAAARMLCDMGLGQYEISNFAKKGYECRHNLKYWKCCDYVGIGPSAHSLYGGKRYAVPRDLEDFINSERQSEQLTDDSPCGLSERIMLALRLSEGFGLSDGGEYADVIRKKSELFERHGLVEISDNRISLTRKGFLVSNEIICRLTDDIP